MRRWEHAFSSLWFASYPVEVIVPGGLHLNPVRAPEQNKHKAKIGLSQPPLTKFQADNKLTGNQ
jgi:hypothetical protein